MAHGGGEGRAGGARAAAGALQSTASCYYSQQHSTGLLVEGTHYGATLWRTVPEKGELEARAQLPGHAGVVHAALWRAGGVAATLDDSSLRSWQLGEARAEVGVMWLPFRVGTVTKRPVQTSIPATILATEVAEWSKVQCASV